MHVPPLITRLLHRAFTARRIVIPFVSVLVLGLACTDANAPTITAPLEPKFAASTCTLGLTDAEARATINDLIAAVNALEASGVLNAGQANALRGHLANILKSIDAGNYCAAKSQLQAYMSQVKNFVDGGVLTPEQGGTLTAPATEVIVGVIRFARIQAGHYFSCGLSMDGTAYCWGANAAGQLGDGTTTDRLTATRVATNLKFAQLSGGGAHMCALTSDGTAYCWGANNEGQLGDGTNANRSNPTAVNTSLRFKSISAAGTGVYYATHTESAYLAGGHTCALTLTGAAYCWGYNRWGTSGDGTEIGHLVPTLAAPGLAFASLSTWENHTCGITTFGETQCWGLNVHGQLGNGTTSLNITNPVTVAGGIVFTSLSAGWQKTCGITSAGVSYCWGFNMNGQVGDGTTIDRPTPTPVSSAAVWSSITAGGWLQTCGLANSGTAYCWGVNLDGVSLGTGLNTPNQLTPTAIGPGLGLQFIAIHSGMRASCAITTSNRAYCWGDNTYGAIGDGTTQNRGLPIAVKGTP